MKISGFTFIKNGCQYDYPFVESIRSLLPLVDELIVNVGDGEDKTREIIEALARESVKIKVLYSVWDKSLREGGRILAQQTDIALKACTGDWGIYLQADEVLHEADYQKIRESIERAHKDMRVEGLLFDYVHFYGDFFIVSKNPSAYRREVRAIRLGRSVESYGDAQGFRIKEGDSLRKLFVLRSDARVFHYGWVRPPTTMEEKTRAMDRLYHSDGEGTGDNHRYTHILGLEPFTDTHPLQMTSRIKSKNWHVDLLKEPMVFNLGDIRKWLALKWEKLTGELPFSYKNYVRLD